MATNFEMLQSKGGQAYTMDPTPAICRAYASLPADSKAAKQLLKVLIDYDRQYIELKLAMVKKVQKIIDEYLE